MRITLSLCLLVVASALQQPLPTPVRATRPSSRRLDTYHCRSFLHNPLMASATPADVYPAPMIQDESVELPNGTVMQLLSSAPEKALVDKPVILFMHGSFHGAWCWTERFFPFFVSKGYRVAALSWKGTGGNFAGEGVKKVKIEEHVEDFEALLAVLPKAIGLEDGNMKPVVICHSFGGIALMKALEMNPDLCSSLSGIATMCSVPPSGNGKMTMRYLRRSLVDSWKITAGFAMKRCLTNGSLCRELFFGGKKETLADGSVEDFGVSDEDLARYQEYFRRDSSATIDVFDLAKKLPSFATVNGYAPFVDKLPPCLVLGAKDDFIVDRDGLDETAQYFGLENPVIVDSPHDVMLGKKWENAASALANWLEALDTSN